MPHLVPLWLALGTVLVLFAATLAFYGDQFSAERDLVDMPALPLAAGLVLAGVIFCAAFPLVKSTERAGRDDQRRALVAVVVLGLAMRVVLASSTPAFEDDWNRYLWDGAVTAQGFNPYAVTPDDAQGEPYAYTLQPLARASGTVIERVNHSHLKTIYPPVAQAAFALAYTLEPWSLIAWRTVLLAADVATLGLILALLCASGRSPLWAALYWWNPVVVKELMNSAHMEGIVTPFVLAAALLAIRGRHLAATGALGLAIGAKIWPVVLAPLILRPLISEPRKLALGLALLGVMMVAFAWPIVTGGLDETSGYVAFVKHWQTNSAHFPALRDLVARALAVDPTTAGLVVRAALAVVVLAVALGVSRRPIAGARDLTGRLGLVTVTLYLLSPVQFPWYAIWMLPFLCFRPRLALLAVTALVPLYYTAFHFKAHDMHFVFRTWVVWMIWVPVWMLLLAEAWWGRHGGRPDASAGDGSGARADAI